MCFRKRGRERTTARDISTGLTKAHMWRMSLIPETSAPNNSANRYGLIDNSHTFGVMAVDKRTFVKVN